MMASVAVGAPVTVDIETAREFMREALGKIPLSALDALADELELRHRRMRALLLGPGRGALDAPALRAVLRSVFATRRRADALLAAVSVPSLTLAIDDLLGDGVPVAERLQAFHDRLPGLPPAVRRDLGSELLHATDPDRYWLWTRWIWDPATRTGALPLVLAEGRDLHGRTVSETYRRVGRALASLREAGRAAGFARLGDERFGVDLYLACVYGVYVSTTIRLRLTQEFNHGLPPLAELVRRLLGVYRMEL